MPGVYLTDKGTVSLSDASVTDRTAYRAALRVLEAQRYWRGAAGVRALWAHQRTAIAFAAGYIASDKTLPEGALEAALIKMPTGTGKSGVVAVVTRCLPRVRRALVLTPRTALTQQLRDDIAFRFWGNIGFNAPGPRVWSGDDGDAIEPAAVEVLLPNLARLRRLTAMDDARLVVVGTLQALDQIRSNSRQARAKVAPGAGAQRRRGARLP